MPQENAYNLIVSERTSGSVLGWQAGKKTLKERFSFLLTNEVLADIYFVVGQGDNIKVWSTLPSIAFFFVFFL